METGTIVRFDGIKGYGFIEPDSGGEDVFLHASILDDAVKQVLRGGMRVGYASAPSGQGTKALAVQLLGATSPAPTAVQAPSPERPVRREDDELCDVLRETEFAQKITDVLIEAAPSMTGSQILQVRKQLVTFAQRHGWVEA
ncbi:cold-shock protein [Saccharopolyspora phatthalungensis]|uniref:Cold shock CspA family protein n=1 Tax=Saccharopolyspora phatthalungensis TaxID=664693 RepID=A0A840Q171_9PSEU|nr:cold shock domain-containing protein [Saccharopolyspora phatthalungensis]MBB5152489.1 cold shock CspA family protein [Saccharopolyspora phatthalungensis]